MNIPEHEPMRPVPDADYLVDDKDWFTSYDTTGRGVRLAEVIGRDGEREYVVLVEGETDLASCICDAPPHEATTGKLPAKYRRALGGICQGVTSKGKPCARIPGPNGFCASHDPDRICGHPTKTTGRPCHMPKGRCGEHRDSARSR